MVLLFVAYLFSIEIQASTTNLPVAAFLKVSKVVVVVLEKHGKTFFMVDVFFFYPATASAERGDDLMGS